MTGLSRPSGRHELAYAGTRSTWTERPTTRSRSRLGHRQRVRHAGGPHLRPAGLEHPAAQSPAAALARRCPASPSPPPSTCGWWPGRVRRDVRYVCAIGKSWQRALGPRTGAKGELRIAGDRWLLSRTANRRARDRRAAPARSSPCRRAPATQRSPCDARGDGTLAWLERSGAAARQRPRARRRSSSPRRARPAELASSDATIYWTAGGVAERWHR